MPGPGLLYLSGRTLAHGRREGLSSLAGSTLGGLVHVAAAAIGLSAIVMASATAFSAVKIVGGAYLLYLAWRMWRSASDRQPAGEEARTAGAADALRQGFIVEASNPKTAAFFLALIPQFIEPPAGPVALQFCLLGAVSVALNSMAGLVAILGASWLRSRFAGEGSLVARVRKASALMLGGLGVSLLLTRRPV